MNKMWGLRQIIDRLEMLRMMAVRQAKKKKKMCMRRKFIVYYEVNLEQGGRKLFQLQQKNAMKNKIKINSATVTWLSFKLDAFPTIDDNSNVELDVKQKINKNQPRK